MGEHTEVLGGWCVTELKGFATWSASKEHSPGSMKSKELLVTCYKSGDREKALQALFPWGLSTRSFYLVYWGQVQGACKGICGSTARHASAYVVRSKNSRRLHP